MHKERNWKWLIVPTILTIVSVGIFAYPLIVGNLPKKILGITSGEWVTYEDKEFLLSFEYPKNIFTISQTYEGVSPAYLLQDGQRQKWVEISLINSPKTISEMEKLQEDAINRKSSNVTILNTREESIGGKQALQIIIGDSKREHAVGIYKVAKIEPPIKTIKNGGQELNTIIVVSVYTTTKEDLTGIVDKIINSITIKQ